MTGRRRRPPRPLHTSRGRRPVARLSPRGDRSVRTVSAPVVLAALHDGPALASSSWSRRPRSRPAAASVRAVASALVQGRESFAEDLWRYGEDALAAQILDTDDDTYRRVMRAAGDPAVLHADARQAWQVSEMAALGAVQVLTGASRHLKRRRRRPQQAVAESWRSVGRDRPDLDVGMVDAIVLLGHGSDGELEERTCWRTRGSDRESVRLALRLPAVRSALCSHVGRASSRRG